MIDVRDNGDVAKVGTQRGSRRRIVHAYYVLAAKFKLRIDDGLPHRWKKESLLDKRRQSHTGQLGQS
ncbi:MAG: hypothetical protein PVSMB4_10900 [Ktedonobacterales bacterium]